MQEESSIINMHSNSHIESVQKGGKQCRICLQNEIQSREEIRAPCKCEGSVKYVHVNCLKQWILTTLRQKGSAEIMELQKQGMPCQLCKQKIYFELTDTFGCRGCGDIRNKIKYNLKSFVPLLLSIIFFLVGCAICLILSANIIGNTSMHLVIICLAGILGLSAILLLFYMFFQFAVYQDIEVKNIQTMVFNQKRILGHTTDNWKRNRNQRIHVSNID